MSYWYKKMSRTDAQQATKGYPVPYLRLTKAQNPFDNQTWFRQKLMSDANWTPGFFGENEVEEAHIKVAVSVDGNALGIRTMLVTHDDARQDNNNTPNTYLHYDDKTRGYLQGHDTTGKTAKFGRNAAGKYSLDIY